MSDIEKVEFKCKPIFLLFRTHAPGESRVLKASDADVLPAGMEIEEAKEKRADRDRVSASKRIFECEEARAIRLVQSRAVNWLKNRSMPSFMMQSVYALRPGEVKAVTDELDEWDTKLDVVKEALRPVYSFRVGQQKQKLNAHFQASDYPPVDAYLAKYSLERRLMEIRVPSELQQISEEVWRAERDKHAVALEKAAKQMRLMLREQFAEIVTAFRRTIEPDANGDTRQYSKRLVNRLQEFRQLFDIRDLTGDAELAKRMTDLESLAGDVSAKRLQSNKTIRDWFAREVKQITQVVDDLVDYSGRQVRVVA